MSTKTKPVLTISIPTLNSEKYLPACIAAIKKQTYTNYEINIVDGGSTDKTVSYAKKNGIAVIVYPYALLGSRYEGVKVAKGKYVLLLDSDQILEKRTIERAMKEIQDHKLDMLILEEEVYKPQTLIDHLFVADRKLAHSIKDFSPYTGVLLPRFFHKTLLKKAFASIPQHTLKTVGGQDHAIIYFEASRYSHNIDMLPNAVKHIEPSSLIQLWKKFYRWGYTSYEARSKKYSKLLKQKERLRTGLFSKGLYRESLASILLLFLKGIPGRLGYLHHLIQHKLGYA